MFNISTSVLKIIFFFYNSTCGNRETISHNDTYFNNVNLNMMFILI